MNSKVVKVGDWLRCTAKFLTYFTEGELYQVIEVGESTLKLRDDIDDSTLYLHGDYNNYLLDFELVEEVRPIHPSEVTDLKERVEALEAFLKGLQRVNQC